MKKGYIKKEPLAYIIVLILLIIIISNLTIKVKTTTPTNESNYTIEDKSTFCGRSSFAYCTAKEQCIAGGCDYQLCGANSEYRAPLDNCSSKDCYNSTKYNLECTCYKSLCQWRNKTISAS